MRPLCSLAAVAVLATAAVPTHAQIHSIERRCDATFFVRIAGEEVGGVLRRFNPGIPDITPPHRFEADGRCGALVPNRCRRRASEVAFGCMGAMAVQPTSLGRQEECPTDPAGHPRMVFNHSGYVLRDPTLETYLGNYVCAAANNWYDQQAPAREGAAVVRYQIYGRVWGDTGCGGGDAKSKSDKLATHTMTCPRVRGATSDIVFMDTALYRSLQGSSYIDIEYRGLSLPREDYQLCRQACLDDARCLAWQYAVDFVNHPGPHCKLMDHYPQRRRVQGVVSGMR